MIEERDKGELVHDFLSGVPHIFAMVEGDDMSVSMEGKGGHILVLWAKLTMDLMEKMGQDDPKALLELAFLASLVKEEEEK